MKGNQLDDFSFYAAAALIKDGRIYTVHARDCRVGKVIGQGVEWLTIDYVPAYQQYLAVDISDSEYTERRNRVAGWLKPTDTGSLEVNSFEYSGEPLLLRGDGFWAYADEKLFLGSGTSQERLVKEVQRLETLGEDNISAIFIDGSRWL